MPTALKRETLAEALSELQVGQPLAGSLAGARAGAPAEATDRPFAPSPLALINRHRFRRGVLTRSFRAIDWCAALGICWMAFQSMSGLSLWDAPVGVVAPFVLTALAVMWGLRAANAYHLRQNDPVLAQVLRAIGGLAIGLALSAGAAMVLQVSATTWNALTWTWLALGVGMSALSVHYATLSRVLGRSGRFAENVVIVGATPNAQRLIERNAETRDLNVVAIFDDRLARAPSAISGVPVVGTTDDMLAWPDLPHIDRIIITVSSTAQERVRDLVDRLRALPNRVVLLLDLEGFNPEATSLSAIAEAPAAYLSGRPDDARRALAKRLQDLVIGSIAALLLIIPLAVVALLVRLDSPGPIFFRQVRHGFNNKMFKVWKFRTMYANRCDAHAHRQVVCDDPRITRLGRFLRATSIDELPQLINVLWGDMSLVGPRPHAVGMRTGEVESHLLVAEYAHRHRIKPGITGWAAVNGSRGPVHTAQEVRDRVRLDLEYVDRQSFWFDLWIMLRTIPAFLGDSKTTR